MTFPSEEAPGLSVFSKMKLARYFTPIRAMRADSTSCGHLQLSRYHAEGRDEEGLAHTMAWVRHHDKYEQDYFVDPKQGYIEPAKASGSCCSGDHHE